MSILAIEEISPRLTSEAREILAAADVVLAIDRTCQQEHTVFGVPALESTGNMKKPSAMRVVRVSLDCKNAALDELSELVRRVKGLDAVQPARAN